jgi:hypothetical protein
MMGDFFKREPGYKYLVLLKVGLILQTLWQYIVLEEET